MDASRLPPVVRPDSVKFVDTAQCRRHVWVGVRMHDIVLKYEVWCNRMLTSVTSCALPTALARRVAASWSRKAISPVSAN